MQYLGVMPRKQINSLPAGKFFMLFCCLQILFKINYFEKKIFQEYNLSVKWFGSRSGPIVRAVQTVYKSYQQRTVKEVLLKKIMNSLMLSLLVVTFCWLLGAFVNS